MPNRKYRLPAALFFIGVLIAMIWPVYPYFSRIHPMVLGIPFSLAYIICLLVISFLVLLTLYLWEAGQGEVD